MKVIKVDEVDDSNPTLVTYDTVNESLARSIADSFHATGEAYGCLLDCDGKRYRPFLVQQTKPGWWQVKACLINLPKGD